MTDPATDTSSVNPLPRALTILLGLAAAIVIVLVRGSWPG